MTKITETLSVGSFIFDCAEGVLLDASGQEIRLRPQTRQVLAELAGQAGGMVSKQDLLDAVWPDVHVTDDSLVQCVSEIRKALGPDGGLLETVPKKGYRLKAAPASGAATVAAPTRRRRYWPTVVALAVMAAIGVYLVRPLWQAPRSSDQTIAVMPFVSADADGSQDYLSNGLAEDLIIRLSGLSDLRVLSRSTSFPLGGARDAIETAAILNADYLVEGSVRSSQDGLRISTALVDGRDGSIVWATQFDGDKADILGFQDEVLYELLRALSVQLSPAERERLGVIGTRDVDAHDAYLRARELENLYTADTNLAAERALMTAIRRDPGFALAHAHLALVYSLRVENRWSDQPEQDIARAFSAAQEALRLDPDLPFTHFSLGRLYTRSYSGDLAKAITHYERAIELDPNYVDAYMFLANVHIFNGEAERALPLIAEAFDRNPVPPFWYYLGDGMARFFLGDYELAEQALVRASEQNPTAPFPYRFLMATYGMMDRPDDADWTAMEYEALGRSATVKDLLDTASIHDPTYRAAFADAFRRAGLPEE